MPEEYSPVDRNSPTELRKDIDNLGHMVKQIIDTQGAILEVLTRRGETMERIQGTLSANISSIQSLSKMINILGDRIGLEGRA